MFKRDGSVRYDGRTTRGSTIYTGAIALRGTARVTVLEDAGRVEESFQQASRETGAFRSSVLKPAPKSDKPR